MGVGGREGEGRGGVCVYGGVLPLRIRALTKKEVWIRVSGVCIFSEERSGRLPSDANVQSCHEREAVQ